MSHLISVVKKILQVKSVELMDQISSKVGITYTDLNDIHELVSVSVTCQD
jgi:hypothetical protein